MILEYRTPFKGPVRPWWTAEDVYARAPYPCVDRYHMWKDSSFRPFLDWLDREYLSPIEGRAFFVVSTAKQRQSFRAELKNARSIEVPTVTREGW